MSEPAPTISLKPDSERAAHFQEVFGRLDRIPVTHYWPQRGRLADLQNVDFYLLDFSRCTPDEISRLALNLARRFQLQPDETLRDLYAQGCPILAADVWGPALPLRLII